MTTTTTTDHELSKDELAVTGRGITEYGAVLTFVAVLVGLVFTK